MRQRPLMSVDEKSMGGMAYVSYVCCVMHIRVEEYSRPRLDQCILNPCRPYTSGAVWVLDLSRDLFLVAFISRGRAS